MKKITVIGGDGRLETAAEILKAEGFSVKKAYGTADLQSDKTDVLLLPVPTTRDGETLFAPALSEKIYLDSIARAAGEDTLVLSCNYTLAGTRCIDYGRNDAYCLLNAVPTAEGAIALAIENTDFTLWKSRVLVIGNGRVGGILADRLAALGAQVTVSARKSRDFALLSARGYSVANSEKPHELLDFDIIFNTVDFTVLPDEAFEKCRARLIVDLSSRGGFNPKAAENCGITALRAPGLPGKTAPKTAGEILAAAVKEIIKENL